MRIWQSLFWSVAAAALASSAFAAKPLTPRERNARAGLVAQSNNFQVAFNRQLDDELAGLKQDLQRARGKASKLQTDLNASRGNEKLLKKQLQAAQDSVGAIEIKMADLLAAKDVQFAREYAVLASVGDELIATPEGLAALEEYNKGGKSSYVEARRLLDQVMESRERHREFQAQEQQRMKISDLQTSAALDYDAMSKGYQTTDFVILQYEKVTALSPNSAGDWRKLAELYRNGNRLDKAVEAAQQSFEHEADGLGRAQARIELGDAQMLLAFNRAGIATGATGIDSLITLVSANPDLVQSKDGFNKLVQQIGVSASIEVMKNLAGALDNSIGILNAAPELLNARSNYMDALKILQAQVGSKDTNVMMADTLSRLSALNFRLAQADEASEVQKLMTDLSLVLADIKAIVDNRQNLTTEEFDAAGKTIQPRMADIDRRMKAPRQPSRYQTESNDQIEAARKLLFEMYRADKSDIGIRRALVRSYQTSARNDPSAAHIYAGDALRTMAELATERPEISIIRYELAMSHQLKGFGESNRTPRTASDLETARIEYEKALTLLQSLSASDPSSALYQRGMAEVLRSIAQIDGNETAWTAVIEHYGAMRDLGLLAPADEQDLTIAQTALRTIGKLKDNGMTP